MKEVCAKYHRKQPPAPKGMVANVNDMIRRKALGQTFEFICPVCERRIWSEYLKSVRQS